LHIGNDVTAVDAPVRSGSPMTETHTKSRQRAEIAFAKEQSQFFARGSAVEELDAIVQAREEKTSRLREARLAKELQDRLAGAAAPISKRVRKT